MLKNFDELGLIGGTIKNAGDLLLVNITNGLFMKSSSIRWGFFLPIKSAIQEITELVKNKKVSHHFCKWLIFLFISCL